jgi:hypothetical protein
LVIVPCPCASERLAPDGPVRFTKKVSFGSTIVSPFTMMVTVFVVSPGANVSAPEAAP